MSKFIGIDKYTWKLIQSVEKTPDGELSVMLSDTGILAADFRKFMTAAGLKNDETARLILLELTQLENAEEYDEPYKQYEEVTDDYPIAAESALPYEAIGVVGFPKDLDRQGLAQLLSRAAGISPATAESVLDSLLQAIVVTIAKTGTFTLADFGTFSASQQKARKRRGATPNRTIHFQGSRFGFRAATKLENMVLGKRKRKR